MTREIKLPDGEFSLGPVFESGVQMGYRRGVEAALAVLREYSAETRATGLAFRSRDCDTGFADAAARDFLGAANTIVSCVNRVSEKLLSEEAGR